mmetsp:Transcript_13493/g.22086  ORF Transcript_13493/g.22086 Transcript_13493/m.22086 type:complete len:723 (-) Transcript_13493:149-2317(-)|eukprot:jgi/Bigna1/89266/estExt_fgenesh1_pg.C_460066
MLHSHRCFRRVLQQRLTKASGLSWQLRQYNLGTNEYHESLKDLPPVDRNSLRDSAIKYLEEFDHKTWYDDPIRTIIKGSDYSKNGKVIETINAFEEANGSQIVSSEDTVESIVAHLQSFKPSQLDNRDKAREIERELFGPLAGALIGNQALDFKKQDGITEIEEALEAGAVERKMNDMLFEDERNGKVVISREPAFVSCVSNFSNFLDLSRKVLRNIELGVPVVILSRSNTTQHMFRWAQLLLNLMHTHDLDLGLVTYASCDIEQQKKLFSHYPTSPIYFTGSREVAKALKTMLPNTFSSTGGPNTLVSKVFDAGVEEALRTSALIENSGQCTALRHAVLPRVSEQEVHDMFSKGVSTVKCELEAISNGSCASLFETKKQTPTRGYKNHSTFAIEYKVDRDLPVEIEEHWRKAIVDVTSVDEKTLGSLDFVGSLSAWLVKNQPISLAVNGDAHPYDFARALFEKSGLVVYTVGSNENPALTAQARPQDGEIFGELPPRKELNTYTKFPMIVPSPSAAYNTNYSANFLEAKAAKGSTGDSYLGVMMKKQPLLKALIDPLSKQAKGYATVMAEYLKEACDNGPREGLGSRTSLYGLQRPPLGTETIVRADKDTPYDSVVLSLLPFLLTNAKDQVILSVDKKSNVFSHAIVKVVEQDTEAFERSISAANCYNVVEPQHHQVNSFPIISHFVSKLLLFGHVKSTTENDRQFVDAFSKSSKWLKMLD